MRGEKTSSSVVGSQPLSHNWRQKMVATCFPVRPMPTSSGSPPPSRARRGPHQRHRLAAREAAGGLLGLLRLLLFFFCRLSASIPRWLSGWPKKSSNSIVPTNMVFPKSLKFMNSGSEIPPFFLAPRQKHLGDPFRGSRSLGSPRRFRAPARRRARGRE